MSKATTVAADMRRSSWMPTCPSPPAPMTTATLPGSSLDMERLIAWYGVSPASVSGTVFTGSRSPIGTTCRSESTSRYSASAPGRPSPGGMMPRRAARGQ